ncbi:MAG: hypothetical protein LBL87_00985 [Ruminococcus sp.]|jgi:hypothetical protein|nr:hypothetical protein [Ruminococcus sp.]
MLCKKFSERVPSVHFDGNDEIPAGQYCKKCAKELGIKKSGKGKSVPAVIVIWALMPILTLPIMYATINPLYEIIENYGLRMFTEYLIAVLLMTTVPVIGKTVFKVPIDKPLLITLVVLSFFAVPLYYVMFFYILLTIVFFPK